LKLQLADLKFNLKTLSQLHENKPKNRLPGDTDKVLKLLKTYHGNRKQLTKNFNLDRKEGDKWEAENISYVVSEIKSNYLKNKERDTPSHLTKILRKKITKSFTKNFKELFTKDLNKIERDSESQSESYSENSYIQPNDPKRNTEPMKKVKGLFKTSESLKENPSNIKVLMEVRCSTLKEHYKKRRNSQEIWNDLMKGIDEESNEESKEYSQ